nr:MAG TPA: hemolysin [Caudoviricetes sp.]
MEQKFENQGKRPDQLESANRLAGYSFICAIVLIILYAIWNAVQ